MIESQTSMYVTRPWAQSNTEGRGENKRMKGKTEEGREGRRRERGKMKGKEVKLHDVTNIIC